jgi:hypothetical protein|tara:strand:+ start:1975 stop:2592 length:618 start_codon:yes stop_codon:yes gene_type:complete
MTTSIVIIDKDGSIKDVSVKDLDINLLYKKCNFRKSEGFEERHVYKKVKISNEKYNVSVYARDVGKAGTENKYDLPPPIDSILYFGNIALVRKDNEDNILDLTCELWLKIYEKLFGGFEDLSNTLKEDEEEEDELKDISPSKKTKQGYLKDGFVVEGLSEDENEELGISLDSDEETEAISYAESDAESDEGSELEQEEFIFSDDE